MELKLTETAAAALWHALATYDPKGRSEIRLHRKMQEPLRQGGTTEDGKGFRACTLTVPSPEVLDYTMKTVVNKAVEKGVPGVYGQGYAELLDALDALTEKK